MGIRRSAQNRKAPEFCSSLHPVTPTTVPIISVATGHTNSTGSDGSK